MADPYSDDDSTETPQTKTGAVRVLCVDDSADITAALRMVIDTTRDMQCVGCLASADRLVEEVARLEPDVVVVDASMRGKNPFEAIKELSEAFPRSPAVVFSAWDNTEIIEQAIGAGAAGFVCKTSDPERLMEAIREVAAGHNFFPPASLRS